MCHAEVAEACPEMNKPFVEPPLRGYGIMGKVTLGDEVLKVLRLDGALSIEDAAIRSMLDESSREVWDHDGVCACGRKTYLFSRCPNCIEAEALETAAEIVSRQDEAADPPDEGVGIEVGSTLALLSDVAGTVVLSSELLASWAAGFLAAPTPSAVDPTLKLKIPTGKAKGSWCSWIVAPKGLVVPGHQPTPMPSSDSIELSCQLSGSRLHSAG